MGATQNFQIARAIKQYIVWKYPMEDKKIGPGLVCYCYSNWWVFKFRNRVFLLRLYKVEQKITRWQNMLLAKWFYVLLFF